MEERTKKKKKPVIPRKHMSHKLRQHFPPSPNTDIQIDLLLEPSWWLFITTTAALRDPWLGLCRMLNNTSNQGSPCMDQLTNARCINAALVLEKLCSLIKELLTYYITPA